jgi:hypothetical protein
MSEVEGGWRVVRLNVGCGEFSGLAVTEVVAVFGPDDSFI